MKHLIELVDKVIATEYSVAALEHGRINHSDHESCAIIAEEFEESKEEISDVVDSFEHFWKHVRTDADDAHKMNDLKCLEYHAMLAACELIQVAAMARKAKLTIEDRRQTK